MSNSKPVKLSINVIISYLRALSLKKHLKYPVKRLLAIRGWCQVNSTYKDVFVVGTFCHWRRQIETKLIPHFVQGGQIVNIVGCCWQETHLYDLIETSVPLCPLSQASNWWQPELTNLMWKNKQTQWLTHQLLVKKKKKICMQANRKWTAFTQISSWFTMW